MPASQGLYQDHFIASLQRSLLTQAHRWGLSNQTRLTLLCVSENATFRADDPARPQPLVIRVYRPGYHSRTEIKSELAWMVALREAEVLPTPIPQTTLDDTQLVEFDHGDASRIAIAFDFVAGREAGESSDLEGWFKHLGEITAKLHAHARAWTLPAEFQRKTWNFDAMLGETAYWGDWRHALGLDAAGQRLFARCCDCLRRRLEDIGEAADSFGLIHADLRLANLLVDGSTLTVIDFDDCGFGWYLYDFAAAISFIETAPNIPQLQQAWVQGYRRISPLSTTEVDLLPTFIMLRRLLLTAWIASHNETPTARELGGEYTRGSLVLAQAYLRRHG